MRVFVAIPLPDGVKSQLGELVIRLRDRDVRARWVPPEQMHLTLRFLGDVPPEDAERYGEMLALRMRDYGRFLLKARGVGAFPNVRRPGVIWAGVEALRSPLYGVQEAAEEEAWAIGLAQEKREFRPHVTVGRMRDPRNPRGVQAALQAEQGFDAGAFAAECVALYASSPTPQGPHYRVIRAMTLGG